MKRFWIVSELFYPEETSTSYLLTKIAHALTQKYEVNVICGAAVYDTEKSIECSGKNLEIISDIKIKRINGLGINKNSCALLLALNSLWLSCRMTFSLWWNMKKEDQVFIVTTPVFLLLFISFLKRLKNFPLRILVYDVFPENAVAAGLIKSDTVLGYKLLKRIFDKAYSCADILLVIGRDMKEIMDKKIAHIKSQTSIEIIGNWAEISLVRDSTREKTELNNEFLQNKVVLQYAGNMGRVQGLMELLEIIGKLCNPDLFFFFIGSGALKNKMKEFVQKLSLKQISFEGSYARKEQNQVLNKCDIAIITLADGMYGLAVPSKSYNIMAAGKPILFIGAVNSEIWKVVEENQIGFCFAPSDREGLIRFLNTLSVKDLPDLQEMGRKARKVAETYYAEDVILERYVSLL